LVFLRGCGLPDRLIDCLPSLLDEAIQYYSCFISYASKDDAFAKRLHADLQKTGVRCWFAPEDMKIGDKFRRRIDEAIHFHERLLLILSENSVSSEWVEKEVETAFEKEQRQKRTVLFPLRLDDAVMECNTGWSADIRRTRHIGDFRRWKDHDAYQQAFDRVLRDLKPAPG
jgi:TIR domain